MPNDEQRMTNAGPRPLGRRVLGTVAFCQKDWFVTPRQHAKCARELHAWTAECMASAGKSVRFMEELGTDHSIVRNAIAAKFWGNWLLQLDCDHTFLPNILQRMLAVFQERKLDVLTGLYYQKKPPYLPVIYTWNDRTQLFEHMASWPGEVFRVDGAGGGCLLVRRGVFGQLARLREIVAERGSPSERPIPASAFGQPFDRIPEWEMSEDLSFFYRCYLAGIKVWAHPGVVCHHLTSQEIGPTHFAETSACLPKSEVKLEVLS